MRNVRSISQSVRVHIGMPYRLRCSILCCHKFRDVLHFFIVVCMSNCLCTISCLHQIKASYVVVVGSLLTLDFYHRNKSSLLSANFFVTERPWILCHDNFSGIKIALITRHIILKAKCLLFSIVS